MPKKESPGEFFARSRGRGSVITSDIVNGNTIKKRIQPGTVTNYTLALKRWDHCKLEHPDATPNNIKTSKEWIRCIAYGIEGAYGNSIAGLGSVDRSWKDLIAGWLWAERKPKIHPGVVTTISNFIKGPLREEISLPYRKRERKYGTMIHFIHLGTQLWSNDWHVYRQPKTRLEVWGQLQMQVFTSARVGEYIQSTCRPGSGRGLHYRDITFAVIRNEDGRAEFAMTFKPDKRSTTSILTYLVKFIPKGDFKDYKTMDALLTLEPAGDEMFQLHWVPEVLDLPFFQKNDGQIDTANIFSKRLRDLGFRSGYETPPTIHDFRAEGLFLVDKLYSTAQRMKHGGHTDENTHHNYYAPNNAGIDGQGSYFGNKLRNTVNDSLFRQKNSMRFEIGPEFEAIEQELEDLSLATSDDITVTNRRRELRAKKKKLVDTELRKSRKLQPSRILNEEEINSIGHHQTLFSRVRALMPERNRLATSLFTVASIRSEEGQAVLRDMIALYQQETEVAIRPGLEPERYLCWSTECKRKIDSKPAAQRWRHIYRCHKKSLRNTYGFAEMCFFCSEWVVGQDQWKAHCQLHLDDYKSLPAQCDPLFYGGTLALPGMCPFCLDDATLSAVKRMHQFHDKAEWRDHVSDHFEMLERHVGDLYGEKSPRCPIPRSGCPDTFISSQQVKFHLQNNHGIEFVKRAKKARTLDEVDANYPDFKRVRRISEQETDKIVGKCSKFVYQTTEECRVSSDPAICSAPSSTLSTAPSMASPTPSLINSRASTPLNDAYGSATCVPDSQICNDADDNIDPILLTVPNTVTPAGGYRTQLSSFPSFTIASCESDSVAGSSEVCNVESEYDVIDVGDLTDLEEKSEALEASESLAQIVTTPRALITAADDSWLELCITKDTLIGEKAPEESTGALIFGDIATEKGEDKYSKEELVFVSPDYQQLRQTALQEARPSALDPEDDQFEVERVIDRKIIPLHRGRRKKMIAQYLVKWKGYPEDDNTWVNEADMHQDLIDAYMAGKSSD